MSSIFLSTHRMFTSLNLALTSPSSDSSPSFSHGGLQPSLSVIGIGLVYPSGWRNPALLSFLFSMTQEVGKNRCWHGGKKPRSFLLSCSPQTESQHTPLNYILPFIDCVVLFIYSFYLLANSCIIHSVWGMKR